MAGIEVNEYCGILYNILVLDFIVVGVVDTKAVYLFYSSLVRISCKNIKK